MTSICEYKKSNKWIGIKHANIIWNKWNQATRRVTNERTIARLEKALVLCRKRRKGIEWDERVRDAGDKKSGDKVVSISLSRQRLFTSGRRYNLPNGLGPHVHTHTQINGSMKLRSIKISGSGQLSWDRKTMPGSKKLCWDTRNGQEPILRALRKYTMCDKLTVSVLSESITMWTRKFCWHYSILSLAKHMYKFSTNHGEYCIIEKSFCIVVSNY